MLCNLRIGFEFNASSLSFWWKKIITLPIALYIWWFIHSSRSLIHLKIEKIDSVFIFLVGSLCSHFSKIWLNDYVCVEDWEMSSISVLGEDEVSSFFESSPPLKNMEEIVHKLNGFIQLNSTGGRRIVCVTSGGTTVPLEQRCVRYIDNFSSGNRGAASTE